MIVDTDTDEFDMTEALTDLVSSGGYPYIKITLIEPERGGVEVTHHGLADGVNLAVAFRQLADAIEAQ